METMRVKVAVIGGGASGLVCAITCAERFGKNTAKTVRLLLNVSRESAKNSLQQATEDVISLTEMSRLNIITVIRKL